MDDETKRLIVLSAIKKKFLEQQTWTDLKTLLGSITKTNIKTFVKNALQAEADKRRIHSQDEANTATELESLKSEIDSI